MKTIVLVLGLFGVAMMAGCATGYVDAARNNGRGYAAQRISDNVLTVSFTGNSATQPERARDLALLRAAELATEGGFAFLRVEDASDTSAVKTLSTAGTSYGTDHSQQNVGGGFTSGRDHEMTVVKPAYEIRVLCRHDRPKGDEQNWWPAKETVSRLRAKYGLS